LLQDDAEHLGINGTFDANAHPAEFDLNGASVLTDSFGPVLDHFRDTHWQQWRWHIQPAFAEQFSPVEDLVSVDSVASSHHCHRSAWL
jgi:hypothetical protein